MSRPEPSQMWKLVLQDDPSSIDWNKVAQRAESHPDECREGDTRKTCYGHVPFIPVLHRLAILSPPVDSLRAVIRAYPQALFSFGSKMPLLLACESGSSNDIIRTFLQEMQRAWVSGIVSHSAITLLYPLKFWDQSCPLDRLRLALEELTFDFGTYSGRFDLNVCLGDLVEAEYDKIQLVLMKLDMGTVREEELGGRRFYILHAFMKLLCRAGPRNAESERGVIRVLNMIKERNPDQFRVIDDDGLLPLHIAATIMHRGALNYSRRIDHRQRYQRYTSTIVGFLLEEYPESLAIPDRQGRLPLHIASQDKLPCYEILASAEPRALVTRCTLTHLYPFQLAALPMTQEAIDRDQTQEALDRDDEHCQWTDKIFTLLRKTPHLVQSGVRNEPWKDSQEYLELQRINLMISQLQARKVSLKRKVDAMKG